MDTTLLVTTVFYFLVYGHNGNATQIGPFESLQQCEEAKVLAEYSYTGIHPSRMQSKCFKGIRR